MVSPIHNRTIAWLRPTSLGGAGVVLASIVSSIAAYGMLGEYIRIRWSVGVHYGPTHAPTEVVLGGFPVAVAFLYVGCRWLIRHLDRTEEFDDVRQYFELAVAFLLGFLVVMQVILIGVNLYLGVSS